MQRIELTYLQMVLIGLAVGVVLGLIPLVLGIFKKKIKLGIAGFLVSAVAGAIWSLLSLVTVGLFIWLILKKDSQKSPTDAVAVNENPLEVSADNLHQK